MGKKSGYSVISASSVEYDAGDGTSLQRRPDPTHQHAPYSSGSSEIGGSSISSFFESKHVRTGSDIPMADMTPSPDVQDDMQETPSYQETAMLSHHSTRHRRALTNSFYDPEESKTALSRSFNPLKNLVHLLALGTTIPVLWLNFNNIYWADEDNWKKKWFLFNLNQQDTFNALQFAAKLHGIFVAASVSAMTMHIVRRKLIGASGLPFGLVVGAYQIGSAEYFKSKNFSAPLFKSLARAQWNVVFIALLIGISVIYVNMIGPASAALLIPTLDWYPVKDPFGDGPFTTYFWPLGWNISTDNGLYPQLFNVSDTPNVKCTNESSGDYTLCPGAGFHQLENWCASWALSGLQYDPLMDVLLGKMKRQVVSRITGDTERGPRIAVASTMHNQINLVLDLFSQYVDVNSIGKISSIRRPRILAGPTELWSAADASTDEVAFNWIPASVIRGMHDDVGTLDASIAALARVPIAVKVTYPNGTKQWQQESLVVSCMFDARWAATSASYDPKQDNTAHLNLTDPIKMLRSSNWMLTDSFVDYDPSIASNLGIGDTIVIDKDWAELLNAPHFIDHNTFAEKVPAIRYLLRSFMTNVTGEDNRVYKNFVPIRPNWDKASFYANVTNTIEILLSTLVADGIARANDIGFLLFLQLTQESSNGTATIDNILTQAGSWDSAPIEGFHVSTFKDSERIEFTVERYGWGYGLNPPTAKFAVAILLAYVVMFFLFQIMCFIFLTNRRGWTSRAWEDIGELVALAAMSRESEALQNTGAGIDKGETWITPVRIRERESQRVELIFGDTERDSTEAYGLLEVGKKYH